MLFLPGWRSPNVAARGSGGASPFDPLSLSLFAAMEVPPDGARKTAIDTCVRALVAAGVWAKLDALYVFAAHDAQAALLNWINPAAFEATAANSPTFTEDEGYAGNGTDSYVDTNCNSGLTTHYTQNSACFGIWTRVVGDNAGGEQRRHGWLDGDAAVGCYISSFSGGDPLQGAAANINGAFDNKITVEIGGTGLWVGNRSAADAVQLYHDGQEAQTGTTASVAIEAFDFWLGTRNFGNGSNQSSNEQFSAALIGGSLDATQQLALHNALLAYMQAVGAVS